MTKVNSEKHHVTDLLVAWSNGQKEVESDLMPLVEIELRRIAHNFMRKEDGHHTLQTSALVNEAYLKLIEQRNVHWQNRSHFFALATQIMRRILINHARDRTTEKRGGGAEHVNLEEIQILTAEESIEIIALNEALEKLAEFDKTKARIVELRYFGGLTLEETAEVLGLAPVTVSVHWRLAKAWLSREIRPEVRK
jgi:RNA polymerase sigma factor (TIGR02999 family)